MSRTLPCPKCEGHMWEHQIVCDYCKPIETYKPKYLPSSLIELANSAVSDRYKTDMEFQNKVHALVSEESSGGKQAYLDMLELFIGEYVDE